MKVLSGEIRAEGGSVTYNDVDLPAFTPVQLARLRAVLPQSTQLAFPFTALEIVRMGAVAQGSRAPEEQARRALARAGLRGFEQRSYNMLSGGEQQRVQFARALAQVPNPMENGEARALFLPLLLLGSGHPGSLAGPFSASACAPRATAGSRRGRRASARRRPGGASPAPA